MDRAIKEIVSGIVQRSVSIATQTTKELVLKVCCCSLMKLLCRASSVYSFAFWLCADLYTF